MSDQDGKPKTRLQARLEAHRQELLAKEQSERRRKADQEGKKPSTGPLPPSGDPSSRPATGLLRPLAGQSAHAAAQIIDRYLPRTRRLTVLLTDENLMLTDIPGFDPARFEISFGRVNSIITELEAQFKLNDNADHPRLADAAQTLLNDKIVAARFLLEMLAHLKHSGGDNAQTWQLWEHSHRNAATVVMYQYLYMFEEVLGGPLPQDDRLAIARAFSAFVTYASPTSFLGRQHARYLAVRQVLGRAIRDAEIDQPEVDVPPDPEDF